VGDGYAGKVVTIIERIIPNTRHAVGDDYAGKVVTTIERIIHNTRHAVGDGVRII